MNVTIMSDASFCHETHASGWGVWVKSERGTRVMGGNFAHKMQTSAEAEAKALAIAVFVAFDWGIALPGDYLVLQIDCQEVISAHANARGRRKELVEAINYINEICKKNKCRYKIKHVKGHTSGKQPRNYINNLCDKHAKTHMKLERGHV